MRSLKTGGQIKKIFAFLCDKIMFFLFLKNDFCDFTVYTINPLLEKKDVGFTLLKERAKIGSEK
ncbi:hypothetical protein NV63_13555 [Elizabethkingia anophelis]|nr:hypothetical protein NV63_13555 [Elizabethkingia anophelis]